MLNLTLVLQGYGREDDGAYLASAHNLTTNLYFCD